MAQRVTIVDVAKACGVVPSTVSNALANKPYVTAETKRVVVEASERLGYRASAAARGLRLGRSWTIGLLASDIANSFYADILIAIEDEAWSRGYSLLIGSTQFSDAKQSKYIESFLDRQVDGLILASHSLRQEDVELLQARAAPTVFMSRFDSKLKANTVGVDNLAGGRLAMDHLLEHGHRRIGFIGGPAIASAAPERYQAYRDALIESGLEIDPEIVAEGDYSEASGRKAAARLLSLAKPLTAIFCVNDRMAFGVMAVASELGLRIPEDLSLVGFDDIDIAAHPRLALTTVHTPRTEIGRTAASVLFRQIEEKEFPLQTVLLRPRLVIRRTVAAPRND